MVLVRKLGLLGLEQFCVRMASAMCGYTNAQETMAEFISQLKAKLSQISLQNWLTDLHSSDIIYTMCTISVVMTETYLRVLEQKYVRDVYILSLSVRCF